MDTDAAMTASGCIAVVIISIGAVSMMLEIKSQLLSRFPLTTNLVVLLLLPRILLLLLAIIAAIGMAVLCICDLLCLDNIHFSSLVFLHDIICYCLSSSCFPHA